MEVIDFHISLLGPDSLEADIFCNVILANLDSSQTGVTWFVEKGDALIC